MLNVVLYLEAFKNIIFDAEVIVFTDNRNITFDTSSDSSRVQRWKLAVSNFNCKCVHTKGIKNKGADYLSGMFKIKDLNLSFIAELQKDINQKNTKLPLRKEIWLTQKKLFYIPANKVNELIEIVHLRFAHPGTSKQYYTMKDFYYFKNMKSRIDSYIKECTKCQMFKNTNPRKRKLIGSLETNVILQDIASDIYGPFEGQKFGFNDKLFIITYIDRFSRFSEIDILYNIKGYNVATSFENCWIRKTVAQNQYLQTRANSIFQNNLRLFVKRKE